MIQDVCYCLRQLRRSPGFALTAVFSLALGIGATTAVFSVVYAALIKPYPYRSVERIVRLTAEDKARAGDWIDLSGPQIQQVHTSAGAGHGAAA